MVIPFGSLSFSFGSLVVPIGVLGVHFGPRSFSFGSFVVSFGFVVDPFDLFSFSVGSLMVPSVRCVPLGSPLFGECFFGTISLPTIPWLQDNIRRAPAAGTARTTPTLQNDRKFKFEEQKGVFVYSSGWG